MIENYLVKARQRELLAEAERQHLAATIRNRPSAGPSKGSRFLVYIGALLCSWGSQLLERFSAESPQKQVQGADRGLKV